MYSSVIAETRQSSPCMETSSAGCGRLDPESTYTFYTDLTNRWIRCVMDLVSRADTKFLIDIDAGTSRPRATREPGLKSVVEIPILLSTLTERAAMATQRKFRTGAEFKQGRNLSPALNDLSVYSAVHGWHAPLEAAGWH